MLNFETNQIIHYENKKLCTQNKNRILKNIWLGFLKIQERPLEARLRRGRPFERFYNTFYNF